MTAGMDNEEKVCNLVLTRELIERMPWMPEGATLRAIYFDFATDALVLCVEGYGTARVPGAVAHMVAPSTVLADDGRLLALRWPSPTNFARGSHLPGLWGPAIDLVTNRNPEDCDVGVDGRARRDIAEGEVITMPLCVYDRILRTGSSADPEESE